MGGSVRHIADSRSIFHILDFIGSHNDFLLKEYAVNRYDEAHSVEPGYQRERRDDDDGQKSHIEDVLNQALAFAADRQKAECQYPEAGQVDHGLMARQLAENDAGDQEDTKGLNSLGDGRFAFAAFPVAPRPAREDD